MHPRGTSKHVSIADTWQACVRSATHCSPVPHSNPPLIPFALPLINAPRNIYIYHARVILRKMQDTKTVKFVNRNYIVLYVAYFLLGNCLWHLGLLLKLAFLLLCICFLAYSQVCMVFSACRFRV